MAYDVVNFSVVIPTFQRRHLMVRGVEALSRQKFSGAFEVIVVVDGSTDGSAQALRSLPSPFPLRIIEQPNLGLARARNRGAAEATGEILLFLDDDMEADARLLVEHARSHQEGADAVVGAIPLHPDSPDNLLTAGIKAWCDERHARLASVERISFDDVIGGQFSIARVLFEQLGGYDERFTKGGAYGAEDVEFGYRLLAGGRRVVFNRAAVSYQFYEVDAATHLRQYRQVGHADVAIVRKHPELGAATFARKRQLSEIHRLVWRPVLAFPLLTSPLRVLVKRAAIVAVDRGHRGRLVARIFFAARAAEYWKGVAENGGIPRPRPVRVLNYHDIADLAGDPVLHEYGVPPDEFARQLDQLVRAGYHFLTPDEFLRFLEGDAGVPKWAVLLTFDDCYRSLLANAAPMLDGLDNAAIAFAVSGQLGGSNEWDQRVGARRLELLGATELKSLMGRGFEVGAHSRTHRALDRVPDEELDHEIAGSVTDLEAAGLGPIRFFAYPYGVHDAAARAAAQSCGLRAAFTVDAGRVHPSADPYALPRVEIRRQDRGWRFRWRVLVAGYRLALRARIRDRLRKVRRARLDAG